MPLNVRSIAVAGAVTCFFLLSFVGWLAGLSSFACCKRAVIGATVAYITVALTVKAINAVLINAMAAEQANKQRQQEQKQKADYSDS